MPADLNQLSADMRFIRSAVERRSNPNRAEARFFYTFWAAYVLVGYLLIDVAPRAAGWFFMIGGIGGGLISWFVGNRMARQAGDRDRAEARKGALHWAGGMVLSFVAAFALACVTPALRGPAGSQVLVVMIGLVYYFHGVHYDRNFLWLGPLLVAGGVAVIFIPYYPWTCLGIVIAAGLVIPAFLAPGGDRHGTGSSGGPQQEPAQ